MNVLTEIPMVPLANGQALVVDELESVNLLATFTVDGSAISPSLLQTAVLTVCRHRTGAIVNSINEDDVLNAGKGKIEGNTLKIRLDGDDTGLAGNSDELHEARLVATYNDGEGVRQSTQRAMYWVRKLKAVTA